MRIERAQVGNSPPTDARAAILPGHNSKYEQSMGVGMAIHRVDSYKIVHIWNCESAGINRHGGGGKSPPHSKAYRAALDGIGYTSSK